MMLIAGWAVLGIVAIVLLIDLIPIAKDWLGRIHIGRFGSEESWRVSITQLGQKWLTNTPKIKVTDNTRLVTIDMLRGQYSSSAIQHWQEASLLLGLSEHTKQNGDMKARAEVQSFLNSKFTKDGQWIRKPSHVDSAILAYAIMKLDWIDSDVYRMALDATWELIKEHLGADGTVAYRKSMQGYRYVDTIGFICPFLVAYGLTYKKIGCIDLAVKQIQTYEQYGMLQEHFIPCHAYKLDNKTPLGLYGWGRGLGWFAIGLIDAWNELPEDHDYKPALTESVKKFAKAIIPFQQPDGNWNWTVTRAESRADSSATATLAWFLLNASRIHDIEKACQESTSQAVGYLMKVTRRNGAVDFSQGDTKDIGVYAMLFNILPFTQGFCMRIMNSQNLKLR